MEHLKYYKQQNQLELCHTGIASALRRCTATPLPALFPALVQWVRVPSPRAISTYHVVLILHVVQPIASTQRRRSAREVSPLATILQRRMSRREYEVINCCLCNKGAFKIDAYRNAAMARLWRGGVAFVALQ